MTNFGLSAFLKLVHLNERPRLSELRKRLRGPSEGGYDYHRSLRIHAKRLLDGESDFATVIQSADQIQKLSERASAKAGLQVLNTWANVNIDRMLTAQKVTIESPTGVYKVTYAPDFGASIRGVRTAVHIWNTMKPDLAQRLVHPTLAPFYDFIAEQGFEAISVLSLREGKLYSLENPSGHLDHAAILYEHIEELIEDIMDDGPRLPGEDRPAV